MQGRFGPPELYSVFYLVTNLNLLCMILEFLFIPPFLLPFLPALLSGAGMLGSAVASKASLDRMNRYNDPRAQLQRLNAAGLPFAAFAAGQSGEQSTLPDVSGIAGAGQALGNYFVDRNQMASYDAILEDIRRKGMENDLFGESYKFGMEDAEGYIHGSNAYQKERLNFLMTEADHVIRKNQSTVSALETGLIEGRFQAGDLGKEWDTKLAILLKELEILGDKGRVTAQEATNLENFSAAKQKIIDTMQEGGLSLAEALLLMVMEAKL